MKIKKKNGISPNNKNLSYSFGGSFRKQQNDFFNKNRKYIVKKIKEIEMRTPHQSLFVRYLVPFLITLFVYGIRLFISQDITEVSPFFLIWAPVLGSAFYGGLGPGLVATLLNTVLIAYTIGFQTFLSSQVPKFFIVEIVTTVVGGILISMYIARKKDEDRKAQRQIMHQAVIANISQHRLEDSNLTSWLDDTLSLIAKTVGMKYGAILELLPQENSFSLISLYGVKKTSMIVITNSDEYVASQTINQEKPVIINNFDKEKRLKKPIFLKGLSLKSGISMVIPGQYQAYGVLSLYSDKPSKLNKYDIRFLQTAINVIANTIERDYSTQILETIADSTTQIAPSLDLTTTLRTIGEFIVPRLADFTQIIFIDNIVSTVYSHTTRNSHEQLLKKTEATYSLDKNLKKTEFVKQILAGKPYILPFATDKLDSFALDTTHREALKKMKTQSLMVVPLIARDTIIGCIIFGSWQKEKRYELKDLVVASEISGRAASAIDNANLFNEAKDAIRTRDEFLSIASHELKTPLTSMLLQLQSILHSIKNESLANFSIEKTVRLLESTKRQSDKLSKLVNDLLNISLITTGRMNLEIEKTDLAKITRDIVERFESQIAESKCKISILGDTRVVGEWDKVRIEQVVTNLLSNAIKYGKGKSITITIKKLDTKKVQFVITDHGIGIPPEHQKRVFSRFERGIPTREYEGLGVGLYIVAQIINHHKGTIKVESELGKGTTFTILLPLSTSPSERSKARDSQVIRQRI